VSGCQYQRRDKKILPSYSHLDLSDPGVPSRIRLIKWVPVSTMGPNTIMG
jgi:hypothetical protein